MDGSLRVGARLNKTNRLAVIVSAGKMPGKRQIHMAVMPVRSVVNAGASKPRQRTEAYGAGQGRSSSPSPGAEQGTQPGKADIF